MKKITVVQVDAFTDRLFGGNPAAVVTDASCLSDDEMKHIAREMNLSETAFILPSGKADFRLRYFTPTGFEVKFCGHATVGTLHTIASRRMFSVDKPGQYKFQIETNAGILNAGLDCRNLKSIQVFFESPGIDLVEEQYTPQTLAAVLGISSGIIDSRYPMMRDRASNTVYITVKSLDGLGQVSINQQNALAFAQRENIVLYCLLTVQTFVKGNNVHLRAFAPLVGIAEDPVTGALQGGLAAYAHRNGLISALTHRIRTEQGYFVGRPGGAQVAFSVSKGKYKARVIATAVTVFATTIRVAEGR